MPAYLYRAVHASGIVRQGRLIAANENALASSLQASGLELISARIAKSPLPLFSCKPTRFSSSLPHLMVLCRQLADLLQAGVPLLNSLEQVAAAMPSGRLPEILIAMAQDIEHGVGLTPAFAQYPALFDPVFLALLRTGEASGDCAGCFARLAEHLKGRARVAAQLKRALRYPLFLFLVAAGTVSFMMTMVVPQIAEFLRSLNGELPFSTRLLILVSDMFGAGWWLLLITLGGVFAVTKILRRQSSAFALRFDRGLLRVPLWGEALHQLCVAPFAESFALLLPSGLSVTESLAIAAPSLQNRALIAQAREAKNRVEQGEKLSAVMEGLLSPFALQMLRVGEQSGQLPKALQDIARHYDETIKDTVERLIGALEPALTLLIGGLLAWVVLAVLGPIYGNLGKIGQVP
jgi:type IV pilus assembly protein PilC